MTKYLGLMKIQIQYKDVLMINKIHIQWLKMI